ncbi:hypothetical protein GGR52DRAFT_568050 [Hypoxylon sp. FL1284]|nr:hypothetical protein GGR52DRAFT_568050 [Hypoxylon sp. FL1284]
MATPSPGLFVPDDDSSAHGIDNNSPSSATYDLTNEGDKVWSVEDLYAERPHPEEPGRMQYLIKWEGYPMNECTWEPAEHLGPGLLEEWEENKKKIATGERKPFDLEIFYAACRKGSPVQDSRENAPPTTKANDNPDRNNRAQEADSTGPGHLAPKQRPETATKQKESRAPPSSRPGPEPEPAAHVTQNLNKKKPSQLPPKPSQLPLKPPQLPPKPPKDPQRVPAPKRTISSDKPAGETATGYQGTARRASGGTISAPAPRRPPALPPTLSSSLANKFSGKKHKATRTQPQPQPRPPLTPTPTPAETGNVFAGGTQRKKRTNLGDVMDDTSKAPKAFHNMRTVNMARKRGNEKGDTAHLDVSAIPPSFLLTNDGTKRPNEAPTTTGPPPTQPGPQPGPSTIVQSPTQMSPSSTSNPVTVSKTKRSVRFTRPSQDDAAEDVPMGDSLDVVARTAVNEQDSTAGFSTDPVVAGAPPSVPRKLSLTDYQGKPHSTLHFVKKTVVFGKAGSQPVEVRFAKMDPQDHQWFRTFKTAEVLNFDKVCASYNFVAQKGSLIGEILSTGVVEPISEEIMACLRNVAVNLRRVSQGSHLIAEHFSILVYPAACDAWDDIGVDPGTYSSSSPLRFIVYRPVVDAKTHPPASVPRAPARLNSIEPGSHCQMLLKHLFGLDFSQCLPQQSEEKGSQVFMLLFPRREMQVCNLIKLWLRSCQPGCRIFSSEIEGSFTKFHTTVRAGAAGTVILHEDMSAAIRVIPLVAVTIDKLKRCYTYWNLATGQYDRPMFPSDIRATLDPGSLQMTRLFPYGRAFLITPSLALSDPIRLCQFLDWFRTYCNNPHYLIVACADFPYYLQAITLEKEKEYQEMCSSHKDDPKLEELLAESGLSGAELEARFKAWSILKGIIKEYGDEETDEDVRKVEWITNLIDPNDEQSLVNWFCWWAATKCDRYRKFAVLGSKKQRTKAAYRDVEIPAYAAGTVEDPDVAWSREDEHCRAREAAEDGNELASDARSALVIQAKPAASTASNYQSRPLWKGRADEMRGRIEALQRRLYINSRNLAKIHYTVVSWSDVSMADHFGDPKCDCDTFNNWLGRRRQFTRFFNTWCGLFYTIDREWNPRAPPESYGHHPWFAAIRPKNPHKPDNYNGETELFIWDISAKETIGSRGRSFVLLDVQKRLVDVVRDYLADKDEQRLHLEDVYVSNKAPPGCHANEDPLTVTVRMAEHTMMDLKKGLPPLSRLLIDDGWALLDKSEWKEGMSVRKPHPPPPPARQQRHKQQQQQQRGVPFPRHPNDDNKAQKYIWHAPRAKAKFEQTKCGNDLYRAAFRARMSNMSCEKMRYQYRSTVDWYHDMKNEGRASSHVLVDTAENIIASLPKALKKPGGS